jgi:glyoxylase-like metal-dependent hydrolase (beta-lactamase superfamily II)
MRLTLAWIAATLALALPLSAQPGSRPAGSHYLGRAFEFRQVAEGVYLVVGTGALSAESNTVVVVNQRDVLIVDSETSPAAAWALLMELKSITSKPVRRLVVTHFHYDHAHGIQSFPPDVEVIGTEYTRRMVAEGASLSHPTAAGNRAFSAAQVANLSKALDTASTPASRRDLERRRAVWQEYQASIATITPVAPNVAITGRLTLTEGNREIVIFHPGPAHTAGDLVVWLPRERVLAVGDLVQPSVPYLGDGYFLEWAAVLDSLRSLNPAVVLPGHGDALTDLSALETLRDYLRDVWTQSVVLKAAGVSAEEAAGRLDLGKYDRAYPRPPGWTDEIVARRRVGAVRRVYQLVDGAK